jgi:hypothetical protein
MAQWILNVALAGVNLEYTPRIAPAGTGAFIMVRRSASNVAAMLAKVDAAGAVLWKRLLSQTNGYVEHYLCARGSDCVVVTDDGGAGVNVALINGADGTITWQTQITDVGGWGVNLPFPGAPLTADAAGNILLGVKNFGNTLAWVVKLDGTTGASIWASEVSNKVRALAVMSDNRPVVSYGTGATPGVMTLNASTGALDWARQIVVTGAPSDYFRCAVDPSDNIYSACDASDDKLYVTKFSSSGATAWDVTATLSSGGFDRAVSLIADAASVYVGCWIQDLGGTYTHSGVVVLNAAGTTATGARYLHPRTLFYGDGMVGQALVSGAHYGTGFEENAVSPYRGESAVYRNESFDSQTFGTYARVDEPYTLSAGAATVSSVTPTVTTGVAVTAGAGTLGSAADATYTLTLFSGVAPDTIIRFAHEIEPDNRFGSGRLSNSYPTTSIAPAPQFGNPALDYNLETYATAVAAANRFGGAFAYQYLPGGGLVHRAQAVVPANNFGAATMAAGGDRLAAPVLPAAQLGAPLLRLRLSANAVAPAVQFGTAAARPRLQARSIDPDARFGAATLRGLGGVASIQPDNRFGTSRLEARGVFLADSIGPDPRFGLGSVRLRHLATPLYNRPRFGQARLLQPC